jgi:dihydrofolate reductase
MISLLVAYDLNKTIGKDNQLPWHLPADLAYFKRVTMGRPIIMGRKTHDSIGRALPGRENIILTRNRSYTSEGCTVIHTLSEIKEIENQSGEEVFVIGGAEIFNEVLEIADRLYVTLIEDEFEGDTFFPSFDEKDWELISKEKGIKDEKNPYEYYYLIYDRKQ